MRKAVMLWGVFLLCLAATVNAVIVIGPPDDPVIIDDSSGYQPGPEINPEPTPSPTPPLFVVPTVNAVNISGLDCSHFPLICMYVDVLDQNGIPMGGMTADSFCVKEDGTNIGSFTVQQLSMDSCITSVCLVVDVSGSMADNHKLDSAKAAMHRFVNNINPYDRVAIVPYSSCIGTITAFTSNKTTLNNAINALSANNYTACFDGIYKGVDLTRTELGSKAVIAFTDGLENRSQSCYPPPDGVNDNSYADDSTLICNLAKGAGIPIYTFNVGPIDNTWFNPQALQAFANGTGGFWKHAPTGGDIDALYSSIKQRLCTRYYICYNSIDTVQNGDFHASVVCHKSGITCSPCDTAACQELAAPVIVRTAATIALSNNCQPDHNSINICAYVTDKDTPPANLTVTLFYRVTGQTSYTSASMSASPGDSTFCAAVSAPNLDCKTTLDYYITASDGQATVSAPAFNPQNSPYVINICPNHPPVANAGSDQTIAQCTPAPICWPASCSDPDGNLKTCEMTSGTGTFNGSQICFTPSGTLNYEFILKATDSCGAISYDTAVIHYSVNRPPVADAGRDSTLFLCAPTQICWPASCSDPDANLTNCAIISGTGTYNNGSICFTPSSGGTYTFILEATDACGAKDRDTAVITVAINSAPVCHLPSNASYFQCTPTQVCLPVSATDPNGNLKNCQIVSGPGSLAGGNWCYTPSSDQTVNVTIRCEDSCGAYCEGQFTVQFDINQPPVIAFGNDTTIFQCSAQPVCLSYTVSDADNNLTLEQLTSGPGTIDTAQNKVCFTPSGAGTYTFIARATDACGAFGYDTIHVTVNANHPPTANAGSDQNLFQCAPTQICWPASCSDIDGNLSTCVLVSGTGTYNGTNICFTPVGNGTYIFILEATDACGAKGRDTALVTVTLNSPPICNIPPDTNSFTQCTPTEVSLPVGATDPNGNFSHCEIINGPGSIIGGNWVYTPSGDEFREVVVKCLDQCGAYCTDSFFVNFDINSAPVANAGADQTLSQCKPAQICRPASCSDPDGNLSTCALVSGTGSYNGTNICFTPTTSGSYTFILEATDACGLKSRDTAVITINLNHPPTANAGSDQNVFQCTPTQICWPASCSDVDANLSTCTLVSGTGTYNGTNICFTPPASGAYTFILEATDACGAKGRDTAVINVTINGAPTIAFGNDTTLFLCQPQQVCLAYTISDPQGLSGLVESMISGYGAIDTANNRVCFTPTSAGTYQIIAGVTDSCGASDVDTVVIHVSFGQYALIDCPASPISVSLCNPGQVCQTLNITPSSASVSVSHGTYSSGQLCFSADTSGTYNITVIASSDCGADTCQLSFAVEIGQAAQLDCPATQTKFICQSGSVCIPIGVVGAGATVTVTPIGSYNAGDVCFPADTSGHYVLTVIASTSCGSDTCQLIVNVTINSRPVAVNPTSPVDTFVCTAGQICYQFSASDINGGTLAWSKLPGDGAVNSTGQWCFTSGTKGNYTVSAVVTDSCGGADTVSLTYDVNLNDSPTIAFGNDTTIFQCASQQVCVPYTVSDPDNNIILEQSIGGSGTIDTVLNRVCFTPTGAGVYTFIADVTDGCGLTDYDTINVTINSNHAPVANAGPDQSIFQSAPAQICWPASCSDVDGNLTTCTLVSSTGAYNGTNICFTPTGSGVYTFILEATDACSPKATARDTAVITVTINEPPVCHLPNDTSIFQCTATQVCLPVSATDPNGNFKSCQILTGPGSLSNGNWCYTPTADQTVNIVIKCEDSSGAYCQGSFTVIFNVNQSPTIAFGNDTTIFQCASQQVCVPYTVTDPENNVILEQLISGSGAIDTVLNKVCFTPTGAGVYTFVAKATDACGLTDFDTINVTININHPPVASAGADQNKFQCTPAQICWPASCSDVDGNLTTCTLVSNTGTYNGTNICFTPTASGVYTFILEATDACGAKGRDTALITVALNAPPVCNMPPDTNNFFQCAPTQVSLPVGATDPNGNFDHCEIMNSPGSLVGGNWVYTPVSDEFRKVVIKCLDQCGAFCLDSFFVRFDINTAPVVNAGPDQNIFQCAPTQICWPVSCSDADGNLTGCVLVFGPGTLNGGNICFTPPAEGSYLFVLEATDACGAKTRDSVVINVNLNAAPVIQGPPDYTVYFDYADTLCFDVNIHDEDNNLTNVTVLPNGAYYPAGGQVCLPIESTGVYCAVITATDACGLSMVDTVCVQVRLDECIHVQIEKVHNALQGHHQLVDIFLNGSGKPLGGFDFLIAYDNSALNPGSVIEGSLLEDCAWEYFTYRFGAQGNCSVCPSGLIRIVALAETNNGAYHPDCFLNGRSGTMASIDFMVSADRTLNCQYVPVKFYWMDCGDNAISSKLGDTTWISRDVYDFEYNIITDFSYDLPGYYGAPDECLNGGGPGKPAPIRCIDFVNGGVDIICSDSIDARGDVNLNGIPFEIGDAVVLTNYFISGLAAFVINPEGQIAASEVNGDGVVLSVADLVYLIRVIIGDAAPLAKPGPDIFARFTSDGRAVKVETNTLIGAALFVFDGKADLSLADNCANMELKYDFRDGMTRALVYNMTVKDVGISSGNILNVSGAATLVSIDASDYNGSVLQTNKDFQRPVEFALNQNFPNPFNPTTSIEFSLPGAGKWELSIFNVLGQKVESWKGEGVAGYYNVEWNADGYASGIYFYRLTSGDLTATRKMVLLK